MSELAKQTDTQQIVRDIILTGNIGSLKPDHRADYVVALARHVGIDPLTRPFDLLTLQGKTVVYANKSCTDQLRVKHGVSIQIVSRENVEGIYVVTAEATDSTGRKDSDIGAINVKGLAGEQLANAMMKAGTKAKRRVTLSICGLGAVADESELDDIRAEHQKPAESPSAIDDLNAKIQNRRKPVQNEAEQTAAIVDQPEAEANNPTFNFADWLAGLDQIAKTHGWEPQEADSLVAVALKSKGFASIVDTTPEWREKMENAFRDDAQKKKRDAKRKPVEA